MRNLIKQKHINHWARETGRDGHIDAAAIRLSFIRAVKDDFPSVTIQIKRRVSQGVSAGMLTGIQLVLEINQV